MVLPAASASPSAAVILRRSLVASCRAATAAPQARCQSTSASESSSGDHRNPSPSSSSHDSSSTSSSRLPPLSLPPTPSALLTGSQLSPSRLKPLTPTFYTTRPKYISLLLDLQELLRKSKRALEQLHVLKRHAPLPSLAEVAELTDDQTRGSALAPAVAAPTWVKIADMSGQLGVTLTMSQYRNILALLSALARYAPLIRVHLATSSHSKHSELARKVSEMINSLQRRSRVDEAKSDRYTPGTGVDSMGRIWANGRRKESTAMVWIAPLSSFTQPEGHAESSSVPDQALGEVRINGSSISTYFTRTKHREDILHPLRIVNLLGAFNIFALVSGGGHTGQSGAVAHGLAKALVRYFEEKMAMSSPSSSSSSSSLDITLQTDSEDQAQEQEMWLRLRNSVRQVLGRDGVLKRDPRMVERKKTGLAKSRKAYTWVKR